MAIFKKILLLFVVISFSTASDYDNVFHCEQVDCRIALNALDLHYIDTIYFVSVGPIALIVCFGFLLYLLSHRDLLNQPPGDLYFGCTLAEMILTIHWLLSGVKSLYDRNNNKEPTRSDGTFCTGNAYVSFFAGTWEMTYNICFCIYLIKKIKTLLNPIEIPLLSYHFLSLIVSFGLTMISGLTGNLGKNLFGTCSFIANSKVVFLGPLVLIIYYLFAFYAIFYFKNYIPETVELSSDRKKFLNYYYNYILVTSLYWIPVSLITIISNFNCNYLHEPLIDISLTIGNILKMNTPIALTLMRMNDPFIKQRIKESYDRLMRKSQVKIDFSIIITNKLRDPLIIEKQSEIMNLITDKANLNKSLSNEVYNYENSSNTEKDYEKNDTFLYEKTCLNTSNHDSKKKIDLENEIFEKEDKDIMMDYWLSLLTENAKSIYIKAMIIGILINAKKIAERKDSRSSSFFNIKDFSDKTQKQKLEKNLIFTLDNQLIQNELPLIWEKFHEDFENINLKITYHSPKLFDELLMNDKKFLDLDISLAIEANLDQIKSSSKADGGRGGQFFFFSFDNQIIIKSLSNDDFKCMKKILKPYYEHMINNQNSLIMKIYGIYDFAFFNKKNSKSCIFSQKVMIMRNLTGYPKIFVEKIYDLKGSTFQRESLMNKQLKDNVVLKDIDFLKKEKRLFIESEKKKTLLETLKKDSAFFKVNGIIDYSLLVIKINTENSPKIEGWNKKIVAMNGLWSLASIKETGYMYHIGIIDYLQPYNYKKIFEKYSKKFIKANINLDTSSQDPFMYSDRFCKFVEGILSEEIEENDNK